VARLRRLDGQPNSIHTKIRLRVAGIALVLISPVLAQTGDQPDGSRSPYVHTIPLYPVDKDGDKGLRITPDQKNPLPFSTRWSCKIGRAHV
jgi:hypothetical protein